MRPRIYHPGGKLGAQMRKVSELMHRGDNIPLLEEDASMHDVLMAMTSKGFGIAALVKDGALTGVITDGDLRRNMEGLMDRSAAQIANRTPLVVGPDVLAPEALALLMWTGSPSGCCISTICCAQASPENHCFGGLHLADIVFQPSAPLL